MNNAFQRNLVVARLMAGHMKSATLIKRAGEDGLINTGTTAGFLGDIAADMTPGLGTANMGLKSIKDFAHGNYWSGAGNALGAGLSLIPGGGGIADLGKGALHGLGWGAKALGLTRELAPTAAKAFHGIDAGIDAGAHFMSKGVSSVGNMIPGMGAIRGSKPVQWMMNNPTKTHLFGGNIVPGVGLKPALNHMQSASDMGKEMASGGMAAGAGGWTGAKDAPSAMSMLRMSGLGQGEMDPRFMQPAQPFNPM